MTGLVLASGAWLFWPYYLEGGRQRRVKEHYRLLRLGMTPAEVTRIMERSPDCVLQVGGAPVAYYPPSPDDVKGWRVCASAPARVTKWEELPSMYAAAEVAFDETGHSVAQSVCGEGASMSTRGAGPSCLVSLDPQDRPK